MLSHRPEGVVTKSEHPRKPPPQWQSAKVFDVLTETKDTVTLRLGLPTPTPFLAGQYFNVRLPVEGRPRPIQRAYSVASSPFPDPSIIDITVKEMEGGLVSPRL